MEYYRFGRCVVPEGGIFTDPDEALDFAQNLEVEVLAEQIQNLSFKTDDEGTLQVQVKTNGSCYFITLTALKELCKMLRVPASYLNKFPGRTLVLENLNNNPYLKDNADVIKLVVWVGEDDLPVIAGVLPGTDPAMQLTEFLEMMHDNSVFEREFSVLDHIAITDEEIALYFLLKDEMSQESFRFQLGYAIHYSPTRSTDTYVAPFVSMTITSRSGEPFEFDFEGNKKLRTASRKKEDFLSETIEIIQTYNGNDLGVFFAETVKRSIVAQRTDAIRFAVLKNLKSKIASTYNHGGVKIDPVQVVEEVIPEYTEFTRANKDDLKTMEPYAANHLPVNFYYPVVLNRLFLFVPNIEKAVFLIRYRKTAGAILDKALDEIGDIVVD